MQKKAKDLQGAMDSVRRAALLNPADPELQARIKALLDAIPDPTQLNHCRQRQPCFLTARRRTQRTITLLSLCN
jgi:hypothetical protein